MASFGNLFTQDKFVVATVEASENDKPINTNVKFIMPVFRCLDDSVEQPYPITPLEEYVISIGDLGDYVEKPGYGGQYSVRADFISADGGDSGLSIQKRKWGKWNELASITAKCTDGTEASISFTSDSSDTGVFPRGSWFFLVEFNDKYVPYLAERYSFSVTLKPLTFAEGQTPLYDSTSFYFLSSPDDPYMPLDVTELILSPDVAYAGRGDTVYFTASYKYVDGEVVEARDIEWRIEYGVATIPNPGEIVIDSNLSPHFVSVIVEGKSKGTFPQFPDGLVNYATIWVDQSSTGGFNSSNQYFPGGISGSSGIPQGSYDNTFGPNTSSLIPGLNSAGDSTGEGGAVGNDISLSGMYTKYLMNQQYLNTLAQFFWEDNVGIQALKLAFGNPIDSIISLISYPFNLDLRVPTVQQNIFFGKYNSGFPAQAISRSSFQIDWGTIPIDFYWGNFLDYAPYTQVQLYLPWGVGFVSIDPNEVMPYSTRPNDFNPVNYNKGSVRVVTNIELDKGACVHNVIGNRGLVIGSYGGIVGKQIPMTALDQSAKMLALLGAASGVGMAAGNAMAGAATGKYTNTMAIPFKSFPRGQYGPNMRQGIGNLDVFDSGAMSGDMGSSRAMKAGLASAAALASTPPNYPRAGTFSDATNTMCAQVPYIIISRPSQSVPQNYGHYNGYPSNIYYNKLSMVSGYTELSEIHLDNVPGSVEELEELDSMLKGGVLL